MPTPPRAGRRWKSISPSVTSAARGHPLERRRLDDPVAQLDRTQPGGREHVRRIHKRSLPGSRASPASRVVRSRETSAACPKRPATFRTTSTKLERVTVLGKDPMCHGASSGGKAGRRAKLTGTGPTCVSRDSELAPAGPSGSSCAERPRAKCGRAYRASPWPRNHRRAQRAGFPFARLPPRRGRHRPHLRGRACSSSRTGRSGGSRTTRGRGSRHGCRGSTRYGSRARISPGDRRGMELPGNRMRCAHHTRDGPAVSVIAQLGVSAARTRPPPSAASPWPRPSAASTSARPSAPPRHLG